MRWKYFVPTVVITALLIVFGVFFLDLTLKNSLISFGEMAFGARVEIVSLKTRFKDLSIDIKGFTAANSSNVYTNLFEIDGLRFSVRPLPLLSMKVIVDEMSVEGVKWGTARRTSGALPARKLAKFEKQQKKESKDSLFSKLTDSVVAKGKSEVSELPALGSIKDAQQQFKGLSIDKLVTADDLQSIKEMETLKASLNEKSVKYQEQLKTLNSDDKIKAAAAQLSDLGTIKIAGPQDAEALKAKIESMGKTKDELEAAVSDLQSLKEQAENDFGSNKEMLSRISELKDRDMKALSEKYKIPTFTAGGIAKSLFGPVWIGRVQKTIAYVGLARKYMPPRKKNAKKIIVTRAKGADISFPKQDNPPDFLIQLAALSGTTGGAGKEGLPLEFKGEINDITSDQSMLGRPTKFEINGKQDTKALKLSGILDHRTDDAIDTFTFSYAGLTAKEMNLPQSEFLPSFDGGNGRMQGSFTLKGEDLDAIIELNITGFRLPENQGGETQEIVASLWAGVDSISVSARLSGKIDKLDMSVYSNIDKILGDRILKLYGEKITELQNKMRFEIDRLTNEKKAELTAQFDSKKNEVMKMFTDKQKEVQSKLDELRKLKDARESEARNMVDGAKKQAEAAVEAEKQKASEAVNSQKKLAEEKALAEKQKAEALADAEKKKAQEQLEAEKQKTEEAAKKKAEEEAKNKAQEQLKGLFGK